MNALNSLQKIYSTQKNITTIKPKVKKSTKDLFETNIFLTESKSRLYEGGMRTQGKFKENRPGKPLITIITVVYNGDKYLEKTIQSVLMQSYDNIEYIIVDGGSTDGTLDIIKRYSDAVDYCVSENDNGIYHAMNTALTLAVGKYIGILNADDWYELNAVQLSVNHLKNNDALYSYGNIRFIKEGATFEKKPIEKKLLREKVLQEMAIPHISLFIGKEVYKSLGLFDTSFRIAGDHEFLVRMVHNEIKGIYTGEIIGNAYDGGISQHGLGANLESLRIALKYGKNRYSAYWSFVKFVFKKFLAKLLGPKISYYLMKLVGSRHV
ncbi:glycosyltransferase family 2 protein [Psychromonas ossibalaenae]|uniref:glycosyltransferase family 2 protein n=1 Tax=Psychromonas ossibalaenae TaxID=444922 RepID=UPI0003699503|nr:glycosyltransferase family 2 protein [Psychromonas ossibalaenae]